MENFKILLTVKDSYGKVKEVEGTLVNIGGKLEGKSAYELAVEQGYIGTLEEWLESLKGKGITFIPHVSEEGMLTWTNNGGLENPEPINIKGESCSPSLRYYEGNFQYYDEESRSWITIENKEAKRSEVDLAIFEQNYDINAVDLKIPGCVEYVKDYEYFSDTYKSKVVYGTTSNYSTASVVNYTSDRNDPRSSQTIYDYHGNEIVQPSLRRVIFEEGVRQIGVSAFQGQSNLDRVDFPESLEWVHPLAFSGTKWFSQQPRGPVYCGNVLYSYKVKNDYQPFYTLEKELNIKEGTKTVSSQAFMGGKDSRNDYSQTIRGFSKINFPSTLIGIGDYAFCGIGYYNTVEVNDLPDSVSWVGAYAFDDAKLRFTKLPMSLEKLQSYSFCNNNFSGFEIKIPDKVRIIESYALSSCHITSLDLNTVEFIDGYALADNDIEELVIPDTVREIGYRAFNNCTSLSKVHIPSTVKQISSAFIGCDNLKEVTVGYGFIAPELDLRSHSVSSNSKSNYSQDVLETIIANLGDRTGLSTGLLRVGTNNINKISSASMTEATTKNWSVSAEFRRYVYEKVS